MVFVVCGSLIDVCVMCCLLVVGSCLLFVVCWVLCVVCWWSVVDSCLL